MEEINLKLGLEIKGLTEIEVLTNKLNGLLTETREVVDKMQKLYIKVTPTFDNKNMADSAKPTI